jgi:hypothetical protein
MIHLYARHKLTGEFEALYSALRFNAPAT